MIRKITSETVTIGSFSTGLWFLGHCNENNVFVNDIGKGVYFATRDDATKELARLRENNSELTEYIISLNKLNKKGSVSL